MGGLLDYAADVGTGGLYGAVTGKGFDVTGKGEAKKQAGKARGDIMAGKGEALGYLDESYNTQNALSQPISDLYRMYMPQLQGMSGAPTTTAQASPSSRFASRFGLDQIHEAFGADTPSNYVTNPAQENINAISGYQTPQLQSDFQLDYENDPLFIQQRDQMMKQLNRRMASTGGYASSDADNAMIRNLLPFMQDSYGRGIDQMNRRNQNALTTYGLDMDRQGTLYGMNNQQNQQQYDRLGNLVNIGLSGINSQSGNAQQYGQNRANIATGTSNAMAENRYALGQLGIATSPLNTLATIGSTAAKIYGAGAGGA